MSDSAKLPPERFIEIVRDTPLVSIDLIVRPPDGSVLVGYRTNEPARGSWFVPGGSIRKDEPLDAAFRRIAAEELGRPYERSASRFVGVYEHLYPANFREEPGFGTHYVVLAHELRMPHRPEALPQDQHARYRWLDPAALLQDPEVHDNVKAYFRRA